MNPLINFSTYPWFETIEAAESIISIVLACLFVLLSGLYPILKRTRLGKYIKMFLPAFKKSKKIVKVLEEAAKEIKSENNEDVDNVLIKRCHACNQPVEQPRAEIEPPKEQQPELKQEEQTEAYQEIDNTALEPEDLEGAELAEVSRLKRKIILLQELHKQQQEHINKLTDINSEQISKDKEQSD